MAALKYTVPNDLDLTDIPAVRERDLALVMKIAVEKECALILMRGPTAEDKREIEAAFWSTFEGPTAQGVVTLVRFWCLVEAFATQRFRALLLKRGFELIAPAVAAASKIRLNLNWGFNPQRLYWAIEELELSASNVTRMAPKTQPAGANDKLAA